MGMKPTRVITNENGESFVEGINGNDIPTARIRRQEGEPDHAECPGCGALLRLEDTAGYGSHKRLSGLEYAIHIVTERCPDPATQETTP